MTTFGKLPSVVFRSAIVLCIVFSLHFVNTRSGTASGGDKPLTLYSGPEGGQWHALAKIMEEVMDENGLEITASVGGGVENLRRVGDGEIDIGFTLYSFLGAAGAGEKELPVVNLDNAVLLANLYPQVLYIIVREDVAHKYGITNLGELLRVQEPLRFATLPKGTGSEFIFNMLLKSAYRTNYDQLESQGWDISFQSYADISKRFLNEELDVCAYTAGPGTFLIPALEERQLRAILLPVEEEILDLMTHQFMTISYLIEEGDYKSVPNDVLTLGDYSCLVVQNAIPEDVVYRFNELMWENRDRIAQASADFSVLSPRFAVAGQSKVHAGSLRFWNTPEMDAIRKARPQRRQK